MRSLCFRAGSASTSNGQMGPKRSRSICRRAVSGSNRLAITTSSPPTHRIRRGLRSLPEWQNSAAVSTRAIWSPLRPIFLASGGVRKTTTAPLRIYPRCRPISSAPRRSTPPAGGRPTSDTARSGIRAASPTIGCRIVTGLGGSCPPGAGPGRRDRGPTTSAIAIAPLWWPFLAPPESA